MKAKIYLAAALTVVLAIIGFFWHVRLVADLWPLDRSPVGPNLVASVLQWAIVLIVASLVYPPIRKAVDKWFVKRLGEAHQEVHDHLHHLTEQLGLERFEGKRPKKDP